MEIEKKFLIKNIPFDLESVEHHTISQGYVSTDPVVRIRKWDDKYILTIKSSGLMAHQEIEKPLSQEEYEALSTMVKGNLVSKTRYVYNLSDIDHPELNLELDVFDGIFNGLILAEIEFSSIEKAESFVAPDFILRDVTEDTNYYNSTLSTMSEEQIKKLLSFQLL